MTARTERALALALALEREERVVLAGHLLASLEDHREKPQGGDFCLDSRGREAKSRWT